MAKLPHGEGLAPLQPGPGKLTPKILGVDAIKRLAKIVVYAPLLTAGAAEGLHLSHHLLKALAVHRLDDRRLGSPAMQSEIRQTGELLIGEGDHGSRQDNPRALAFRAEAVDRPPGPKPHQHRSAEPPQTPRLALEGCPGRADGGYVAIERLPSRQQ